MGVVSMPLLFCSPPQAETRGSLALRRASLRGDSGCSGGVAGANRVCRCRGWMLRVFLLVVKVRLATTNSEEAIWDLIAAVSELKKQIPVQCVVVHEEER